MTRTFSKTIEYDYENVKDNIKKYYKLRNFDLYKLENTLIKLETTHKYYCYFKTMNNEMRYKNINTELAIKDFIEGFYDFFWLLLNSRYKAAVLSLRGALEMLVKGFIREIAPNSEKNVFSNNIEKTMKAFINKQINKTKYKKSIKTFLYQNYTIKIIEIYKKLSNITHGNYITKTDNFNDYLLEIMNADVNYNLTKIIDIINDTNQLLEILLELFLIVFYKELSLNINKYQFDMITGNLKSDRFKDYKKNYFLKIYSASCSAM